MLKNKCFNLSTALFGFSGRVLDRILKSQDHRLRLKNLLVRMFGGDKSIPGFSMESEVV
jgi:hypothetical protein